MSGTLFVVATPIGNLEDITLRALRTLREAAVIAAEDTRRTARLLSHHGIQTPTISFHAHNAHSRLPQIVGRLTAGDSVALVSDAGTPGVSDPGVSLVQRCRDLGIPVDVAPGPSAPLAAVVLSGFEVIPLTIFGFPPARSSARTRWFSDISRVLNTLTFFEAPHRILRTLREAADALGERPMAVARELTKVHQELLHGTALSIAERLTSPRGEFTVVVGPAPIVEVTRAPISDDELLHEFGHMEELVTGGRRAVIAAVARKFDLQVRDAYAAIERARNKQRVDR